MSVCPCCRALLGFTLSSSLDQVPDRLAEFEAWTMRYEAEPNVDSLSDSIKKAVLERTCPEPLKTHLQMNLQTYQSYNSIKMLYNPARRQRERGGQKLCRRVPAQTW